MAEIIRTTWHNFPAVALESSRMRVVIVPTLGAKIVSLFDNQHGHEWLVPPMRAVKQMSFGASFVDQDMSGWDEMMPTINACRLDGVQFPDHGEVWSIPWQEEPSGNEVALSVNGVNAPYLLWRSAALVNDHTLRLRYRLTNLGEQPLPYLWAAHPQFAADAQTRIVLPPQVSRVVNVMGEASEWGLSGDRFEWPQAALSNGQRRQLDRVGPVENRTCRKFYVPPEQPVGWAALMHEGLGCQMRLEWSPEDAPYLGIWVDEGTYNARPVAALEPATAYYDSLDRGVVNGTAPVLLPGAVKEWDLLVRLG